MRTIPSLGCLRPSQLNEWIQAALFISIYFFAFVALGQSIPGLVETNLIRLHENISNRFKAGDTNIPMLRLDSFEGPFFSCSVEKSGAVVTGFYNGISNSTDWNRTPLNTTNLQMLIETINKLPPSSKEPLQLRKQVHVSGIRSNQSFHFVYDNRNYPDEVKRLYEIIGLTVKNMPKLDAKPDIFVHEATNEPSAK